jgi:DNA polymerase I
MSPDVLPHQSPLIFDLESDGLLEKATRIHCLAICDTVDGRVTTYGPEDLHHGLLRLHESDQRLCGHNIIAFDIPLIQKLYPWFQPKRLPLDTFIWSQLVTPDIYDLTQKKSEWRRLVPIDIMGSHSLKAWGYRLGVLKGVSPDTTWQTYSPAMLDYCAQDTVVTHALLDELRKWTTSDSAVDLEMEVAGILRRQEAEGICFDTKGAERLAVQLVDELSALKVELQKSFVPWQKLRKRAISKVNNKTLGRTKGQEYEVWDTIEFNPGSNQHIVHCLHEKYGWEPEVFTDKGNPQMDDDVLEDLESLGTMPEVVLIRKWKTAAKILSYLSSGDKSWLSYVTPEGKIHGKVNGCGAGTRRMTHNSPNLGQVPSSRAYLGKECRSLFSPPPGYTMVGVDADQLELRTLSHFLYPFDGGAYAHAAVHGSKANKDDIHWRNAIALGVDRDDPGKTIFYAYIYGAGLAKLGRCVTKSWDNESNIRAGRRIKGKLEKGLPALVSLKEKILEVYKERGYLLDLDGQKFRLRSDHSALNELNQRAGAIIMKRVEVWLDWKLREMQVDYKWLLHIHDEWQFAVRAEHVAIFRSVINDAFAYATNYYKLKCPITGDAKEGSNWSETH